MKRGRYGALIAPGLQAYIDRVEAFYPPNATDLPVTEQRTVYNRMCRELRTPRPVGVSTEDRLVACGTHSFPVRIYAPVAAMARAVIVYFHGGGFLLGDLDSHDDICAELCISTNLLLVSVDYRLAPEHPHPAAFEDAFAGFQWADMTFGLPVILCGESAGGTLAAAVAHAARKGPAAPIAQVLIYPALGGDMTGGSYVLHAEAPQLTLRDVEFYRRIRTGGTPPAGDPTFEPLRDSDFSGLPPTVIFTAEYDPLCSDGEAYRNRILTAGGKALWQKEEGLVHGFLRARTTVPAARAAFERMAATLSLLATGDWPY
jgi:acetyl esterase